MSESENLLLNMYYLFSAWDLNWGTEKGHDRVTEKGLDGDTKSHNVMYIIHFLHGSTAKVHDGDTAMLTWCMY